MTRHGATRRAGLDPAALHSRLGAFRARVERAAARVSDLPARPVVAWSGGKDSTVCADLVYRARPGALVVHLDSGIEFPETSRYVHATAAQRGWRLVVEHSDALALMVEHGGWDHAAPDGSPDLDSWYEPVNRHARAGDGVLVWGLRASEATHRRMALRRYGWRHIRADRLTTAAPIWDWSDLDVHAYLHARGIALNPVYERLRALGVPPESQRVDAMVSSRGMRAGRYVWLRRGWPAEWARLAEALPRLRELS